MKKLASVGFLYCGKCGKKLSSNLAISLGFCGSCRKKPIVGQLSFELLSKKKLKK